MNWYSFCHTGKHAELSNYMADISRTIPKLKAQKKVILDEVLEKI